KANPVTLDPAKTIETPSSSMKYLSFEGLLKYDKNNKVVLGEAASQPKVTNDGKTWTFTLKKGLKWSNGDPVTAQDYVASMRHWADPKTKSQAADRVADLENYEQVSKGQAPTSADRKSTRLNSSHVSISYAVFCLKKKNDKENVA